MSPPSLGSIGPTGANPSFADLLKLITSVEADELGDQIQNLIAKPSPGQQTGEELLGTLALLGGTYLQGRPGWGGRAIGTPLELGGRGPAWRGL